MDFWSKISQNKRPILMYGMGNGADKIISYLEKYGVFVDDFFASDEFVRGHFFHGKKVLKLCEARQKYDDFIILLSFASSLPEVLEKFYSLDKDFEMYAPDVPVTGENLFTENFYLENIDKFNLARSLLADDESKRIFDEVINYKLTAKISHLRNAVSDKSEILKNILKPSAYVTCADLGAYNGDTAKEMLNDFANVQKIICLEPDSRNFRKLSTFALDENKLEVYEAGAWSCDSVLKMDQSGNRNANVFSQNSSKLKEVNMRSLDSILDGRSVDYIKFDVEGAEAMAIKGAYNTIVKYEPDMLISMYHRSEDMFELPILVHNICPDYKLYLRRFEYVPAWDLNLYAVK